MKLKVIQSQTSLSYLVVDAAYGEKRKWSNGVEYTYEPLPLCRVPDGQGRTREEASALAYLIKDLLEKHYSSQEPESAIPADESVTLTSEPIVDSGEDIPW